MTVGKYTHAIVSRVPRSFQNVPTVDGTCIDTDKAQAQHQDLVSVLRGLGLDVLELPPDEDSPDSVFVGDCAVVVNGVALLCRPGSGSRKADTDTVRAVLRKEVGITVEELDPDKNGAAALINGSDVLFTGSEMFVGVGEETNTGGALGVAATWPEYPCTPVKVRMVVTCIIIIRVSNLVGGKQAFNRSHDSRRGGSVGGGI